MDSLSKNDNHDIIYSPSCHFKPRRVPFLWNKLSYFDLFLVIQGSKRALFSCSQIFAWWHSDWAL